MISDTIDDYYCALCAAELIEDKAGSHAIHYKCSKCYNKHLIYKSSLRYTSLLKKINFINNTNYFKDENHNYPTFSLSKD